MAFFAKRNWSFFGQNKIHSHQISSVKRDPQSAAFFFTKETHGNQLFSKREGVNTYISDIIYPYVHIYIYIYIYIL